MTSRRNLTGEYASRLARFHDVKRAVFAMSLMACTSARAPHVELAVQAPSSQTMAHADAAPIAETCEVFRERVKAEMAKAGVFEPLPTLVGFCSPSWRIDMPDLAACGSHGDIVFAIEAKPAIVHTDRAGHEARWTISDTTLSDYGVREAKTPLLFDFDGDGDPEIFVDIREAGDEGHQARQNMLLTFKEAITPYAPANGLDIDAFEDVDGDGRPDARIFAGYTDTLDSCFSGFPYDHPPARFVAHALKDGTFSVTDDVAKGRAMTWCSAPPSRIDDSAAAICARLWSKDAAAVTREMKRVASSCVTGYCEREAKNQPQPPGSSEDCGRRQQWFAREPPLRL